MRNRDEALDVVRRAVRACGPADGAQATMVEKRRESTRYAENRIAEETRDEDETLCLRVWVDGREAAGCTAQLGAASIESFAQAVVEKARNASRAGGPPFALPGPQQYPEDIHPYIPATALWTPQQRAESVRIVIQQAGVSGLTIGGTYFTEVRQMAVANSAGLEAAYASTLAGLTAAADGAPSGAAGYGEGYARDVMQINPLEVAELAVSRALIGPSPIDLEPGEYEVVLDWAAVADLLRCLLPGFSAKAVQEGRSFLAGALGKNITGPQVSITEDPLTSDGLHHPFDSEGMPRQQVELIRQGVATGVVHDLHTAAREGTNSTGNAADPVSAIRGSGPMPASIFMAEADEELETLIGPVERGVLITRFGQLSMENQTGSLLSGTTQNGTFLIENGIIARPIRDISFRQDILEAFRGIELVSREQRLMIRNGCHIIAPMLKLGRLSF